MSSKYQRWKQGMMNLTATQLLKSKMMGQIGTIIGIIFASVFMIIGGLWYLMIIMVFAIFMQILDYISTRKQYIECKRIEDQLEQIKNLEGLEVIKNGK
jgi:hypothetical protein